MPSTVKPLQPNPAPPDWVAWMENHALKHSVLDQQISQIPAKQTIPPATTSFGVYDPVFQSGPVQYAGPNGSFLGSTQMIFGLAIPRPDSTNGVALLLGSSGVSGSPETFWILQDQAVDAVTNGNNLAITAGETQGSGVANGGLLWLLGGAAFGGTGGEMRLQGGTSLNGPGGILSLFGGNSTNGPAGDVFLVGGQAGTAGANVHLI